MISVATLVLVVSGVYFADARAGGAPPEACDTLTPQHSSNLPQTVAIPYKIPLTQFSDGNGSYLYSPDATYTITVKGIVDTTRFRGFFVQSRIVADNTTRVGVFAATADNTRLSSCPTNTDGVTHVNSGPSRIDFPSVDMQWTAPPVGTGEIYFAFAVVQQFDTFWADQRTDMLTEGEPAPPEPSPTVSVPDQTGTAEPPTESAAVTSTIGEPVQTGTPEPPTESAAGLVVSMLSVLLGIGVALLL